MKLRDYQERAIDLVRAEYRAGRRSVLLVLPTGAGKTATAAELMRWAVARGRRVAFLVHRREIVLDTHRRLVSAGVPSRVVMAGERADGEGVAVCSVQTLSAREHHPPADLLVWDEAHHCAADTYREIRAQYPAAWHLGLTATPERSDGAPLGDAFEALVAPVQVADLVAAGHLAPIDVIAPPARLTKALGRDPVEALREHGGGRPAVIFAATVAESRKIVATLGERAAHIDGGTPRAERDDVLRRFEAGELDAVSNVFVLTEGWDSARAEVCVLARGCGSLATYLQAIGRVRRTGGRADKRCTLIDLAGAVHEHGMPDQHRPWALTEGQSKRKSDREWLAQCVACGWVEAGAKVRPGADGKRHCGRCGAALQGKDPLAIRAEKLQRVERAHQDDGATRRRFLEQMTAVAQRNGYRPGWAAVRYRARYGTWPEGAR
ncbi:MAG TPA: DEAD/DEAH box helicase [Gemmatimonadaceae bacterium]|nr:DEAD/DEAH box helicase [Gemmatimonadaceae bacterium]